MLNKEFILKQIEPYLNRKRELSQFEFFELFSDLSLREQYEIIDIMIAHGIEYVDEKEEETEKLDSIPALKQPTMMQISTNMLHMTNEQLCVLAQGGNSNAVAALIEKNKRFVYSLAMKFSKRFRQTNLSVEDLFQEGNIGLIEAIERFEVTRDNRFITYSWHWIRQKICRAAVDTGYLIRLPVHKFDEITKLSLYRKNNPNANVAELAQIMSDNGTPVTEKDISMLLTISECYLNTSSLNTLVGEGEDCQLQDLIPDRNIVSAENVILEKQLRADIEKALSLLKPREARVLRLRFGLDDGRERTLAETGYIFNLTRERIRQIEGKALRKLRHPSKADKLKPYFEED